MKLPMYQPETPPPQEPQPADLQTAAMVNDPAMADALGPAILNALRSVYDPEIPVNIHDLGLIYDVIVDASSAVGIRMTLTAPNCPAAQWLPSQVQERVRSIEGVTDVKVDVVFDPPWDKDKMSDAAKLQLGLW
jgi:FeS assembly SUF system protein